jgi:hypothetical protein
MQFLTLSAQASVVQLTVRQDSHPDACIQTTGQPDRRDLRDHAPQPQFAPSGDPGQGRADSGEVVLLRSGAKFRFCRILCGGDPRRI